MEPLFAMVASLLGGDPVIAQPYNRCAILRTQDPIRLAWAVTIQIQGFSHSIQNSSRRENEMAGPCVAFMKRTQTGPKSTSPQYTCRRIGK